MRKIVFLIFLVFVVTAVRAEWVKVGAGAKQGETHYFDPTSTQKNDHFRKVWVLASYDQKQSGGYQSVKSLYEFDCQEEKARSHTMLLYPDSQAATSVIGAQHDRSKDWFSYATGSFLAHIAKAVCEK